MRRAADGRVVVPGHRGLIYLAKGLVSLGRSAASRMLILPDGTALDRRALAARRPGESGAAYLARALPQAGVVVLRHGGCYRYACPLGMTRTERAASASACPQAPAPTAIDQASWQDAVPVTAPASTGQGALRLL